MRDSHRLEAASNSLPSIQSINHVMESVEMEEIFLGIIRRAREHKEITDIDLRFMVAAVGVPVMLGSSARPGTIANCTQAEFESGVEVDGTYVVKVADHKTNLKGSARLVFDEKLFQGAKLYRNNIRPLLTATKGDIEMKLVHLLRFTLI